MRPFIALGCAAALGACAHLPWQGAQKTQTAQGPLGPAPAAAPAALDRSTAAEKQAALSAAPAKGQQRLGKTIASIGDPTRPGFWLRTPLVKTPQTGHITTEAKSLKVELLPGSGPLDGDSQMSLSAFRALGLGLTDLPTVTVYGP